MRYQVIAIEEDTNYGCEETTGDVMAVVTLKDENGTNSKHKFRDQSLYDNDIREGDAVYIDENGSLEKLLDRDWTEKCVSNPIDMQAFTNKMMRLMDGSEEDWTCPFCGGEVKLLARDDQGGEIGCTSCDMRIYLNHTS